MPLPPVRRIASFVASFAVLAACHHNSSGTAAASPSVTPSGTPVASRPAGVTYALIAQGDSIFHAGSCTRCHGPTAEGSANGPSLTTAKWLHADGTYESIVRVVTTGVPQDSIVDKTHRFNMRARGGMAPLLTDDQVRAVAAYVWSISRRK